MRNIIAKERVLFDNYDVEAYYKDAEECLRENAEEDEEISENAISNFAEDLIEEDWNIIESELNSFFANKSIVCFGDIGLWHGVYKASKVFDDFNIALSDMLKDCYYFKIYDENGHLFVHGSHHDGSVTFEIKVLNPKGEEYYDRWNYSYDNRSEAEANKQIIKRYSVLPNFMHKVYGLPKVENIKPTKENMQKKLFNEAKSFYS